MDQIKVLFFATLKEKAKTNQITLDFTAGSQVRTLKQILIAQFSDLEGLLEKSIASINQEFAFDDDPIPPGAEVAFFPPVSGGAAATFIDITQEKIDINNWIEKITFPTTGAVVFFFGIVRGQTGRSEPHDTVYLEYEAYIPMAKAKMLQIVAEIRNKWTAVEGIVIIQRIGILTAGTPTVIIACSAAHRDSGVFEAARYGIDRLKEIIPIWKKEVGSDGSYWVEGDYHPTEVDRT